MSKLHIIFYCWVGLSTFLAIDTLSEIAIKYWKDIHYEMMMFRKENPIKESEKIRIGFQPPVAKKENCDD